jgi:hypothetical protein
MAPPARRRKDLPYVLIDSGVAGTGLSFATLNPFAIGSLLGTGTFRALSSNEYTSLGTVSASLGAATTGQDIRINSGTGSVGAPSNAVPINSLTISGGAFLEHGGRQPHSLN